MEKEKILVSACFVHEGYKYSGGNNLIERLDELQNLKEMLNSVIAINETGEEKMVKEETNEKFVNLGGSMILPQAMSDVIAASSEQRIDIETFKLYFDGRMDFDAIYTMQGPVEAFDSIILSNIYAEAIYESNSFTFVTRAHMDLSEDKFPEGIGGISTDVDFVFSENGIESAYAYCNLKSGSQIFNTFTVNNAYLEMKKSDASGEINFAIGGSLRLPGEEKMPQGIANAVISIDAFKINSRGELLEFEAGIVLSDVIVYNAVKLKDSNLRVEKGKDDLRCAWYGTFWNGTCQGACGCGSRPYNRAWPHPCRNVFGQGEI